jgi:hypothetical protein
MPQSETEAVRFNYLIASVIILIFVYISLNNVKAKTARKHHKMNIADSETLSSGIYILTDTGPTVINKSRFISHLNRIKHNISTLNNRLRRNECSAMQNELSALKQMVAFHHNYTNSQKFTDTTTSPTRAKFTNDLADADHLDGIELKDVINEIDNLINLIQSHDSSNGRGTGITKHIFNIESMDQLIRKIANKSEGFIGDEIDEALESAASSTEYNPLPGWVGTGTKVKQRTTARRLDSLEGIGGVGAGDKFINSLIRKQTGSAQLDITSELWNENVSADTGIGETATNAARLSRDISARPSKLSTYNKRRAEQNKYFIEEGGFSDYYDTMSNKKNIFKKPITRRVSGIKSTRVDATRRAHL